MIFVSHALPVNVADQPQLDRAAVWDGLVLKANNALPFVPSMTYCEVTERYSDTTRTPDAALHRGVRCAWRDEVRNARLGEIRCGVQQCGCYPA